MMCIILISGIFTNCNESTDLQTRKFVLKGWMDGGALHHCISWYCEGTYDPYVAFVYIHCYESDMITAKITEGCCMIKISSGHTSYVQIPFEISIKKLKPSEWSEIYIAGSPSSFSYYC